MPRTARLDAPGVLHHIMIRGIERREIFRSDNDRDDIINRLSFLLPQTSTSCYAWALMTNHAHFLLRSGPYGISRLMGRLLTGYVISYNHRYKRNGHLFQNRYKSVICQEDAYLQELVRYIHLNPIRAGIVIDSAQLNKYPYSGHSTIMGEIENKWQDVDYVLGYFGSDLIEARERYLEFVGAGIEQGARSDLVGGALIKGRSGWKEAIKDPLKETYRIKRDQRMLGDSDFINEVLSKSEEDLNRRYKMKRQGVDVDKIADFVVGLIGVDKEDLYSGSRKAGVSKARGLLCYLCVRELGESVTDVSKRLGISPAAVVYCIERGKEISKRYGDELKGYFLIS